MLWLVSGSTTTVAKHPHLGVLIVPSERRRAEPPAGRPWAMDNSAFSGFDAASFVTMLQRWRGRLDLAPPLFVTVPDVVADASATRAQWAIWAPIVRAYGFNVAYVVQDGTPAVPVPWEDCDAVFIGGSTDFKLSKHAATAAGYARGRGKWVHMGRVNSRPRLLWAEHIGCQSVDGTGFSMFGEEYVRRTAHWRQQRTLSFR